MSLFLDFAAIKREVSLKMVLDHIGWRYVWKQGQQQRGPCPIHKSQRPRSRSFAVHVDGWYCHKCKTGGDQISLWSILQNKSNVEAAVDLCRLFNVPAYCQRRFRRAPQIVNGEEER